MVSAWAGQWANGYNGSYVNLGLPLCWQWAGPPLDPFSRLCFPPEGGGGIENGGE